MKSVYRLLGLAILCATVFTTSQAQDTTSQVQGTTSQVQDNENPISPLKVSERKILALNTNFSIPIVKYTFQNDPTGEKKNGDVSLFNTVGAGISFNFGRLIEIKETNNGDTENAKVSSDFANVIGIQLGFIYSADLAEENPTNSFAPTVSLNILDFQLGWGYELGDIAPKTSRHFITLSYGIPLQKLTNTGSILLKDLSAKKNGGSQGGNSTGNKSLNFF